MVSGGRFRDEAALSWMKRKAGFLCVIDVRRHDWRCVGDLATGRRRRPVERRSAQRSAMVMILRSPCDTKSIAGLAGTRGSRGNSLAIELAVADSRPGLGLVNAAELFCKAGELGRVAARGIVGCERLVTFFDGAQLGGSSMQALDLVVVAGTGGQRCQPVDGGDITRILLDQGKKLVA